MFGLGSQELLVILVIVLILFGANRLPQLARSLGASMKEFKKGINESKGRYLQGRLDNVAALPILPEPSGCRLEPLPPLRGPRSRRGRHYLPGRSSLKRGLEAR